MLGVGWGRRGGEQLSVSIDGVGIHGTDSDSFISFFFFLFFCVPKLYLWGSPLLGEIFAYVTVF